MPQDVSYRGTRVQQFEAALRVKNLPDLREGQPSARGLRLTLCTYSDSSLLVSICDEASVLVQAYDGDRESVNELVWAVCRQRLRLKTSADVKSGVGVVHGGSCRGRVVGNDN